MAIVQDKKDQDDYKTFLSYLRASHWLKMAGRFGCMRGLLLAEIKRHCTHGNVQVLKDTVPAEISELVC